MRGKQLLCVLLGMGLLLAAGCSKKEEESSVIQEPTEVINAEVGEEANYGGMSFVVNTAEDPDITLENGRRVLLFNVTIANNTSEPVMANYLNNFYITVNGTDYESDQCCSIPAMKALYDTYSVQALNEEIPAGGTCTGYVACETPKFDLLDLHFLPKTTDRGSRISVTLTADDLTGIQK